MLKKVTTIAMTTVVVLGIPTQSARSMPQNTSKSQGIHLQDGRLYLNQELIHKGFSLSKTRFRYIHFYVPSQGLFTVSDREFEGATQNGTFDGEVLSFSVSGLSIVLKSSSRILSENFSPAWSKLDSGFKLDVKSVVFGYGDEERAPYEWPDQIRKNH